MRGGRRAYSLFMLFSAFLTALFAAETGGGPLMGNVPRYSVDQHNSRRIVDSLEDTGFPFQKLWERDLGGKTESQPIVVDGWIYVQAGDALVKLSMEGVPAARSPSLSDSPMPSGSSPTYAQTAFGDRIYQATRDHRLWALDPETLQPLWEEGYMSLAAGGRPDRLYRITASPLAVTEEGRTFLALGTATGDQTGRAGQYADNGFFILEDMGKAGKMLYCRQTAGEVTGSPLLSGELIIATQNIGIGDNETNILICYDLEKQLELANTPGTDQGIPGSPAAEDRRIYIADRQGKVYCYERDDDQGFTLLWSAMPPPGVGGSPGYGFNLNSPTVGGKYVYLPIRQYRGGGGLLVAYEKETGRIENSLAFDSQLCSNVVYWQPQGSEREFLLVYEASGRTCLLDALSFAPVSGFMDEEGGFCREIMLPHAPAGVKAPEPIIGENHMLLADGAGILHAYYGKGKELEFTCDLAVIDFQTPVFVEPGEKADWTAVFVNLRDEEVKQAFVEWSGNGTVLHRETLDIGGKESVSLSFAWPGRSEADIIRAEVRISPPDPVFGEDERNNVLWSYIRVGAIVERVNCAEVRESGEWQVTYAVLTGYKRRSRRRYYVNSSGRTSYRTVWYTDYNSPIYRYDSVIYRENLSARVNVSTGQGHLPDPENPARQDVDGRGAWEIIPYAREKGLDPDRITRAGAGFNLWVETAYVNDWETKVPDRAEAIGGSFRGPERVSADFYDTRGKLVKTIALEQTESESAEGRALWELPEIRHMYLDRKGLIRRWFYTEPDIPDGIYQVLVRVEGAGVNRLYTCARAEVRIYGSIYDDVYERAITKREP